MHCVIRKMLQPIDIFMIVTLIVSMDATCPWGGIPAEGHSNTLINAKKGIRIILKFPVLNLFSVHVHVL